MVKKRLKVNLFIGIFGVVFAFMAAGCNVNHDLQIQRYTNTNLTNAEADQILADASTILQTNDGGADVECEVSFSRDGDVTAFNTGDGSVDSSAEFNTMLALSGYVAVVNQINWCGALIPNVIGCAPVPGSSMVVVRYIPSQEGILWAHEYGHTKGLPHRNVDPNAVMNGIINSTHRRINSEECTAFRMADAAGTSATAAPLAVQDYVRQVFIHGVPYIETQAEYGPEDVEVLLEMLNDPAEEVYWANVAVVLNIIGGDEVVEPMIAFINEDSGGELSYSEYIAKTSALMSLGYLVNRTGNEQALSYLIESANPEVWEERETADVGPFQPSVAETNEDMSKHAILGLALAGTTESAEALRSFQEPSNESIEDEFQALVDDLITEALQANNNIQENGLVDYYQQAE
jgi:hypothetical protein